MALLIAAFIVVPIVELYVIIQVGQAIGIVPTLLLLLADAIGGSLLLRHQGRGAWRRFNEALAQRRFPAREVADGVMIAVGGTLLLTPGFVTDIFGLLLLIPPTRALIRRLGRGYFAKRFLVVGGGAFGGARPGSGGATGPGASWGPAGPPPPPQNGRTYDFDGTAEEIDADDPQLPRG